MICVKEQGIDALLVLRTCVHRESCVPVLEEDMSKDVFEFGWQHEGYLVYRPIREGRLFYFV